MNRTSLAALCLLPLAFSATASEPLYVKNLSPLAGLIGLPSQRDAATTEPGSVELALHGSLASHYINDGNARERLNLDGETARVALDLRVGLWENWELQVEVPWLEHSGGDLDEFIDDWHDFWGMSDGGREDVARDLLDYRYETPDGGFALGEDASGVGDISLTINNEFYEIDGAAITGVLGYKFATGDAEDFTGSGADDLFVALRMSGDQLSELPLTWHGQVGYLRAGEGDLIEDYQERDIWFWGISMDWRLAQRFSLLAQVDSHAGPFKSDLTGAGDDAWMLSVGARWRINPHWEIDASLVEDIHVESAPDVTFQLSLRFRSSAEG